MLKFLLFLIGLIYRSLTNWEYVLLYFSETWNIIQVWINSPFCSSSEYSTYITQMCTDFVCHIDVTFELKSPTLNMTHYLPFRLFWTKTLTFTCVSKQDIFLSILNRLSVIGSRGWQLSLNFPFLSHINQLWLGDPEAIHGQCGDIISPPSHLSELKTVVNFRTSEFNSLFPSILLQVIYFNTHILFSWNETIINAIYSYANLETVIKSVFTVVSDLSVSKFTWKESFCIHFLCWKMTDLPLPPFHLYALYFYSVVYKY